MTSKYNGVQVLRYIAALAVVVTHSTFYAHERLNSSFSVWQGGTVGVDIFFAISGFVMVLSSARFVDTAGGWKHFIMRRVARIVPMYWIATTLKLAIMIVLPGAALHAVLSTKSVVLSYLFLPSYNAEGRVEPLLGVGWTLTFEMLFYAVFALGLLLRVNVYVFSSVIMVLFALGQIVRGDEGWPAWAVYFDQIVLYFVIGMTVAKLTTHRDSRRILGTLTATAGAAAALMLLTGVASWDRGALFRMIVVTGIMLLVVWVEPWVGERLPKPALYLGDASYSLYLFHPMAAPVIPLVMAKLGLPLPWLSVAISCVAMTVMSVILYRWVERPVTRLAQRLPYAGRMPVPSWDGSRG